MLHFFVSYLIAAWVIIYRINPGRWARSRLWVVYLPGIFKEVFDWKFHPMWREAEQDVVRLLAHSGLDMVFNTIGIIVAIEIWLQVQPWFGVFYSELKQGRKGLV